MKLAFSTLGCPDFDWPDIYSMAKVGINPEINALSTIMFLCVITLLIVINVRAERQAVRSGKRSKKARRAH